MAAANVTMTAVGSLLMIGGGFWIHPGLGLLLMGSVVVAAGQPRHGGSDSDGGNPEGRERPTLHRDHVARVEQGRRSASADHLPGWDA